MEFVYACFMSTFNKLEPVYCNQNVICFWFSHFANIPFSFYTVSECEKTHKMGIRLK